MSRMPRLISLLCLLTLGCGAGGGGLQPASPDVIAPGAPINTVTLAAQYAAADLDSAIALEPVMTNDPLTDRCASLTGTRDAGGSLVFAHCGFPEGDLNGAIDWVPGGSIVATNRDLIWSRAGLEENFPLAGSATWAFNLKADITTVDRTAMLGFTIQNRALNLSMHGVWTRKADGTLESPIPVGAGAVSYLLNGGEDARVDFTLDGTSTMVLTLGTDSWTYDLATGGAPVPK